MVKSNLRFLASHTNFSCSWIVGCNSKKEGLVTEIERNEWQRRRIKGERTYCPSVGRERISYDVRITRHDTLSSKTIRTISINYPREMWRVNGLTGSRSPLLQFPILKVMTNKEKKKKRLSIYLNSKRRHEASDVELLIDQPLKKPLGIGNATPL